MFVDPVDPERDEAPGYFDVVKRPMDLSTVRRKLEDGDYATVHDWEEDVLLTFSNAFCYNGKGSPVGVIAADLQTLFRDLIKTVSDDQNATWLSELVQLRKEMCDHVALRSPAVCGHCHSHLPKQPQAPADPTAEVRRLLVSCMTKSDLERLAASLAQMTEDHQINRIAKIIQHGNPEMNVVDGAAVDLDLLAPQTLRELREFVAGQFEAKGKFG
jgi:hypothetical protein